MSIRHELCLNWNGHQRHMSSMFEHMLSEEALVDVTLACEGSLIKAHKTVLSASSPYFRIIFTNNPCSHPVVILKDISYEDMMIVVSFMYKGKVHAPRNKFPALLNIAQTLKVAGLAEAVTVVSKQLSVSRSCADQLSRRVRRSQDEQVGNKRRRPASPTSGGGFADEEMTSISGVNPLQIVTVESLSQECSQEWNNDDCVTETLGDQMKFHNAGEPRENLTDAGSGFTQSDEQPKSSIEEVIAGSKDPGREMDSTAKRTRKPVELVYSKKGKTPITLQQKHEILKMYEDNKRTCEIMRVTGFGESTLRKIRKNCSRIMASIASGTDVSSRTCTYSRPSIMEQLEQLLMHWIEDQVNNHCTPGLNAIKVKALQVFEDLKQDYPEAADMQFAASNGWFRGFKCRQQFTFTGETASADFEGS